MANDWKTTFKDRDANSVLKSRVDHGNQMSRHDKMDEFNGAQHGHYWVKTNHQTGEGKMGWHYPEGTKKR